MSYQLTYNSHTVDIKEDEDILTCLDRHNISPDVNCGGFGQCGDCVVKIQSGKENLTKMTLKETHLLGNVFFMTKERLGCQCKVTGDVVATKEISSNL